MTEQPQNSQPSNGTSASFGERLRREREMRGIKLEEIAESTKIGKRNLVALEEEKFDQLPGGIFNKGFVRAYARYLGLDEEQAVNDFLTASANYDQPAALQPPPTSWVKPPVIPSDASVRRRNLIWVLLAAILLIGGFIGWFYWRGHLRGVGEAGQQPAPQAASSNNVSIQADPPAIPASNPPNVQTQPAANALTSVTNASPAPVKKGAFTVMIQAKETSWVNVVSDGQQVMNIVIPAGEERTVHAKQELVLKTGNAGGIRVVHNGVPIPISGGDKKVKTLTFNASGLKH